MLSQILHYRKDVRSSDALYSCHLSIKDDCLSGYKLCHAKLKYVELLLE